MLLKGLQSVVNSRLRLAAVLALAALSETGSSYITSAEVQPWLG